MEGIPSRLEPSDVALILGRIEASERATNGAIEGLTKKVNTQNGRIGDIEKVVGIVQDREDQADKARAERVTWHHAAYVALLSTAGTGALYFLLYLAGVHTS